MQKSTIITFAGKGGVGKTSLAATAVRILTENFKDKRILAIDADPAVGLSTALGVDVKTTIDDIRKSIIENVEDGNSKAAIELLNEARFRIFDAMVERDRYAFIAVGRPESAGCYCKINAYLKDVISILSEDFDYVVIDGEAGIEQINRRVMEKVTHLVLVTDQSKKGRDVCKTIKGVADDLVMYEKIGVIVNRVTDEETVRSLDYDGVELLATIGDDANLAEFDLKGESVFELPKESKVVKGVETALQKMGIIGDRT